MQRNTILVAVVFLCFSTVARAHRSSAVPTSRGAENQATATEEPNCNAPSETQPTATLIDTRNENAGDTRSPSNVPDPVAAKEAVSTAVDLEKDLHFLSAKESALAQCMLEQIAVIADQDFRGACGGQLLLNFEMRHDGEIERDIPIGHFAGNPAFFYESGMTIDADGAPNAYHPDNLGLDDLANAGVPGRWEGLAKDADGQPIVQGPSDPFPGYYVSQTALADHSKALSDPSRYVDASKIPFVVLPGGMARQIGARPGDFAIVFNQRNGKSSYAIFADVGPADRIGEGSVALAENLGIRSDARNGGARRGILYLVFPGSGNGRPRAVEEINSEGQRLLQAWEGDLLRAACTEQASEKTRVGTEAGN